MPALHVHTVELHMLEWTIADQNKYLSKYCTIFSPQRHLPCKATISEAPIMVKSNAQAPWSLNLRNVFFKGMVLYCHNTMFWSSWATRSFPKLSRQSRRSGFDFMYKTWWFPKRIRSLQGNQQKFWISLNNRHFKTAWYTAGVSQAYMWVDNIWVLKLCSWTLLLVVG